MKIEAYIIAYNEELLMPYVIRHYSKFADVIIIENNSTDKTVEIAHNMGATVWRYNIADEMNDLTLKTIKNNCWKNSKADWVIIADADEFIYHPDLVNILSQSDCTIFAPLMYNMFSDKFPTTSGQIYDEIKYGSLYEYGVKMNIFRPSEIKEINYHEGCHFADPAGNVKINYHSEIKTLHMRYLSLDFVMERQNRTTQRLSEINKKMGWTVYGLQKREQIENYMKSKQLIKLV
jgi:glycosyltransferase involved in cell wall biosynthesis